MNEITRMSVRRRLRAAVALRKAMIEQSVAMARAMREAQDRMVRVMHDQEVPAATPAPKVH